MTKVFSRGTEMDSCPNPDCSWHDPQNIPPGVKWCRRHGYYDSGQHGKIPRYVCRNCHRTFSERTSHKDCYLHCDIDDLSALGRAWLAGETLGEIAREWGITVQMVRTRLKRLSISSTGQEKGDDADGFPEDASKK